MPEHKLTVDLGERSYDILVGSGLLKKAAAYIVPCLAGKKAVIITDKNVAKAGYSKSLKAALARQKIICHEIVIDSGEKSKSFKSLEKIINLILKFNIDRKTTLIALGGGVVGDLTGFAASIILRGVPFIQIPTTLLAMVDSSVGGKTGINTPHGKNLVGSFYQPQLVLADTDVLKTLPVREWRAGYAEVVKYGLINQPAFFTSLAKQWDSGDCCNAEFAQQMILTSCRAKAAIVAQDEREGGVRALLNLGHTFGHALEAGAGYSNKLLHGEAVAIGMAMAFRFSAEQGICPKKDAGRVAAHLKAVGLPTSPKDVKAVKFTVSGLLAAMGKDKKVKDGALVFILAKGIGKAYIDSTVAPADLKRFLVRELV